MSPSVDPQNVAELRHTLTRLYLSLRRNSPSDTLSAAHASAVVTLLDHGPMRIGEFAERESIRMPTATALIDALERDGLVVRAPDPSDRRAVIVTITDDGLRMVDELRSRRDEVLTTAIENLDLAERAALKAAIPALSALHARLENNVD